MEYGSAVKVDNEYIEDFEMRFYRVTEKETLLARHVTPCS